jgi:chromatin remodeling complex protein RSC6
LKKNKKQRIDPEEDLHLQDLSYPESRIHHEENRKEFDGEKERKKHNKVRPMFVERKVRYSALFTNLVGWHAGAVSLPPK